MKRLFSILLLLISLHALAQYKHGAVMIKVSRSGTDTIPPGTTGQVLGYKSTDSVGWVTAGGSGADTTKLMTNFNYTQFNVKNYGATGDSTQDATPFIQKAVNAAFAHGVGKVYCPAGFYNLKGPWILEGSDDTYCKIILPHSPNSNYEVPIIFCGPGAPNVNIENNSKAGDSTAVIMTTDTSRVDSARNGNYCLIAAPHTNLYMGYENLTFQVPFLSGYGCIQNVFCTDFFARDIVCTIDSSVINMKTKPLYSNQVAIQTPYNDNWARVDLTRVWVEGYYTGYFLNEHASLHNCTAYFNYIGAKTGLCYHTIFFDHYNSQFNAYDIVSTNSAQPGGPTITPLIMEDFDIEADSGAFGGTWNNHKLEIADTNHVLYGEATWHKVKSDVGIVYNSSTYGMTHLRLTNLDNGSQINGTGLIGGTQNSSPSNTWLGGSTLVSNTSGIRNVAVGQYNMNANTTGNYNSYIGVGIDQNGLNCQYNSGIGYNTQALVQTSGTNGGYNSSNGAFTLYSDDGGQYNTANGYAALFSVNADQNTGTGVRALGQSTTGNGNTADGDSALFTNTTGTYNTAIGRKADVASANLTNATAIGNGAIDSASNEIKLGDNNIKTVRLGSGTFCLPIQVSTATSGTVTWNGAEILRLTGVASSLTITLTGVTPVNGMRLVISTNQTSITLGFGSGSNFDVTPTVVTNTTPVSLFYDASTSKWAYFGKQ